MNGGELADYKIICGDCLDVLRTLPSNFINCCVTSPPYYGLRNYFVDGQIGLEQSPQEYVDRLVEVFREVRRVLRDDGTTWVVIGDTYASYKDCKSVSDSLRKGKRSEQANVINKGLSVTRNTELMRNAGLKNKDLIGIPWRVAFALQADGWYLRSDIIWAKRNPIPESVKDRPTKSHEYIFLLSKNAKYYYDYQAILEPANYDGRRDTKFHGSIKYDDGKLFRANCERWPNKIRGYKTKDGDNGQTPQHHGGSINSYGDEIPARNKRSVWSVSTEPFKGAHFAVYPTKLIEPCILAGCPEKGIVLDPFNGSGTTGYVCMQHNRNYIGIDLNFDYCKMSKERIEGARKQMRLI